MLQIVNALIIVKFNPIEATKISHNSQCYEYIIFKQNVFHGISSAAFENKV